MLVFRLLSIFFLCLSIYVTPCYAQHQLPGSFDLRFLEDFAKDLYLRGEIRQSLKEFERIKHIDPNNALADEYLSKFTPVETPIETKTSTSFIEHTAAIADDIKKLKEEIQYREQNIEILKNTLRNSLAENDTLYAALDKRTREVIELRKQLFNLPDAPSYNELMKDIAIERVPQQPFLIKEIPAILQETPLQASISIDDVTHTQQLLEEARTMGSYDPMRIAELQILLDKQRSMLADKNGMLAMQSQTLTSLTQELSAINQAMSLADQNSLSSATAIEQQYQQLLNNQNKQTLKDQEVFLSLLADYSTLIKRIQELQITAEGHHTQYATLEKQHKKQTSNIEELNSKINIQTEKIRIYEKIITAANQEIETQALTIKDQQSTIKDQEVTITNQLDAIKDQQEAIKTQQTTIDEQSQDLSITKQHLNTFHQSLLNIQDLLKNTDVEISSLQEELNHIKAFLLDEQKNNASQFDDLAKMAKNTSEQTTTITNLKKHIKDVYTATMYVLPAQGQNTAITAQENTQQQVSQLNELLRKTEKDLYASYLLLNERDESILDLEEQLQILDYRLAHVNNLLNKELSLKENAFKQNDLLILQLKRESEILHQTLSLRDQQLLTLNQNLLEKDALLNDLRKTAQEIESLRHFVIENEQLIEENVALAQQLNNAHQTNKENMVSLSLQETSFEEEKQQQMLRILEARKSLKEARSQLTSLALELQEKEFSVTTLQNQLRDKTSSLEEAKNTIKLLEERMIALEFKQKAMREIAQQREQEILYLTKELDQTKKAIKLQQDSSVLTFKEKTSSLENELIYAKKRLEDSLQEALKLRKESENLRKDLMMAHAIIEQYKEK